MESIRSRFIIVLSILIVECLSAGQAVCATFAAMTEDPDGCVLQLDFDPPEFRTIEIDNHLYSAPIPDPDDDYSTPASDLPVFVRWLIVPTVDIELEIIDETASTQTLPHPLRLQSKSIDRDNADESPQFTPVSVGGCARMRDLIMVQGVVSFHL